jgi:hypothetical protein
VRPTIEAVAKLLRLTSEAMSVPRAAALDELITATCDADSEPTWDDVKATN